MAALAANSILAKQVIAGFISYVGQRRWLMRC